MASALFDIVICVGPNDEQVAERCVKFNRENIQGFRHIYLVVKNPAIQIKDTIVIPETQYFPFTLDTVKEILQPNGQQRSKWYLQQLLKLYAGTCIPGILPRYLVVDCDTQFIKPTQFINPNNHNAILSLGQQYHKPYFAHMQRLHPSLKRMRPQQSGIIHHMLFDTVYVMELMRLVEQHHIKSAKPFWRLFLENVDPEHQGKSGASEYEMYFNFMLAFHPNKVDVRSLPYLECGTFVADQKYSMISEHCYYRPSR